MNDEISEPAADDTPEQGEKKSWDNIPNPVLESKLSDFFIKKISEGNDKEPAFSVIEMVIGSNYEEGENIERRINSALNSIPKIRWLERISKADKPKEDVYKFKPKEHESYLERHKRILLERAEVNVHEPETEDSEKLYVDKDTFDAVTLINGIIEGPFLQEKSLTAAQIAQRLVVGAGWTKEEAGDVIDKATPYLSHDGPFYKPNHNIALKQETDNNGDNSEDNDGKEQERVGSIV